MIISRKYKASFKNHFYGTYGSSTLKHEDAIKTLKLNSCIKCIINQRPPMLKIPLIYISLFLIQPQRFPKM